MILIHMVTECLNHYLMMNFKFDNIINLEEKLNTPDDSVIQ